VLRRKARPSRTLATVVFTDIAGSTELAARVGDQQWRRILERHHALVRADLRRFGGREVDTAGDGFFATFASPGPAIDFALTLAAEAPEIGVEIRAGVHVGEVELIGGKAGGLAVHIGARIAAQATPGVVLVSAVVRDLVPGSGLRFEDLGDTELKGAGRWRLYRVQAAEAPAVAEGHSSDAERRADARIEQAQAEAARAAGWRGFLRSRTGRLAVLALVAVLVASASVVYLTRGPALLAGVPPDSVGRIDAAAGGVVATLPVGSLPDGITFGAGSLWVTDTTNGTVSRIDPVTDTVIQTIQVGDSPSGVAYGHDAIWVANGGGRTVSRIDPSTNQVVGAPITVGNDPSGIAANGQWVWVTNRLDGTLSRIDPSDDSVMAPVPVGSTPVGVAEGAGALWVSDLDAGEVLRIDPATGTLTARVPVGNGPSAIAASTDAVWVVNSRDGTLSHIDPLTNRVTTFPVGDEPTSVAVGGGPVWVAIASTSEIVRVDPASGQITRRISVVASPQSITMGGADPWFTARAVAASSHAGGTLNIVTSVGTSPPTIDPAHAFDAVTLGFNTIPILQMTNDGLVGYKRVAGSDGLTLTADLAVAIPTPTDGGLTYTFQIRSGITYSDGQPVQASDVRHSFERAVATDHSTAETYGSIVGAGQCAAAPSACDLSKGIVTDDQSGTVTFHLTTPSRGFLDSLAQVDGDILPSSVPSAAATSPLPATGPYEIASATPQAIRLVRNPHFVQWSRDAQPAGYPDEIDWTAVPTGKNAVDMVEQGTADWSSDRLPANRMAEVQTRYAAQLHVVPTFTTFYEFMNTTVPPFDHLDVRQAVNLATDREAVIAAYGGSLSGRVTCQNIPPGFPGYVPYCPYTVNPNPATGAWTGADLAKAQALVAASGTKGTPVVVTGGDFPGFREVTQYFASLLDELGFVASTKLIPPDAFFASLSAPFQMVGYYYYQVEPEPSDVFFGAVTCPDFPGTNPADNGNQAHLCDPSIDQRVKDAVATDVTDPTAADHIWADVDRLVTDAAPAVMAFNPTSVELVSSRVGDFQYNPALGILLDQLWVQ
jgi:YVTN family beta-propeller protein